MVSFVILLIARTAKIACADRHTDRQTDRHTRQLATVTFISGKVFLSLREHGTEPLVVQQCRLLEQGYDTNHTSDLINEANNTVIHQVSL